MAVLGPLIERSRERVEEVVKVSDEAPVRARLQASVRLENERERDVRENEVLAVRSVGAADARQMPDDPADGVAVADASAVVTPQGEASSTATTGAFLSGFASAGGAASAGTDPARLPSVLNAFT